MSDVFGVPIIESPYLPDGQLVIAADPGSRAADLIFMVGTAPLSPLEQAGRDARLAVRRGLADVLEWMGETVENEPTGKQLIATIRQTAERIAIDQPATSCKSQRSAHDLPTFWLPTTDPQEA